VAELIEAVMVAEHGNQTRTAGRLKISVRTIQRHVAELRRAAHKHRRAADGRPAHASQRA
jgi:DNA-binding CsgD family transcriptional regulator